MSKSRSTFSTDSSTQSSFSAVLLGKHPVSKEARAPSKAQRYVGIIYSYGAINARCAPRQSNSFGRANLLAARSALAFPGVKRECPLVIDFYRRLSEVSRRRAVVTVTPYISDAAG